MALIEARHLHKSFGETVAVNELSLAVESGEIYGLVGSDGAGKTTTLEAAGGRPPPGFRPGAGMWIGSIDSQRWNRFVQVGYLSQRFSLY